MSDVPTCTSAHLQPSQSSPPFHGAVGLPSIPLNRHGCAPHSGTSSGSLGENPPERMADARGTLGTTHTHRWGKGPTPQPTRPDTVPVGLVVYTTAPGATAPRRASARAAAADAGEHFGTRACAPRAGTLLVAPRASEMQLVWCLQLAGARASRRRAWRSRGQEDMAHGVGWRACEQGPGAGAAVVGGTGTPGTLPSGEWRSVTPPRTYQACGWSEPEVSWVAMSGSNKTTWPHVL